MRNGDYSAFLANKTQLSGKFGFKPTFIPDCAFDFQKALIEWAVEKGRGAIINRRKAIGIELKTSYYRQALANCKEALKSATQDDIL